MLHVNSTLVIREIGLDKALHRYLTLNNNVVKKTRPFYFIKISHILNNINSIKSTENSKIIILFILRVGEGLS